MSYYRDHADYLRQRARERHAANPTPKREREKARKIAQSIARRPSDPEDLKVKASYKVRYAVMTGKLVKPGACQDCGVATEKKSLHGHHEDYSKPLEVIWVCGKCHGKRHRIITGGAA
jgi:hypothetical protein